MRDDSALLAVLIEIRDDIRGLRADRAAAKCPDVGNSKTLVDLLSAIAATTEGLKFSVAELLEHAEVVANRASDPRLHAAIVAAVGTVNGRRLGKLLCRIEGEDVDGLKIVRVSTGRDGIVWQVAGLRV